jgi:hypothetical protein
MIRTILAALVAVVFMITPAQAGTWKSIATWDIEYAEKGCFTVDNYTGGLGFGFGLTATGEFDLILASESWNLTKGDRMAEIQVDDSTWSRHTATVVSPTMMLIRVATEEESFRVLAVGSALRVRLGKAELGYKLTGTKLMLPELIKCAVSVKNSKFL